MAKAQEQTNFGTEFRKIFWPIEWYENKKFIPMALMMFCILFNYATLRSIKDGLVVTNIGPEALGFLKTYVVLPFAILAMVAYTKLCNVLSAQKIFYVVTSFFLAFFAVFTFLLYPSPDVFHPDPDLVQSLSDNYPTLKWFIRIWGKWSYAAFYTISELWGAMMLSLLFWQFANKITKTSEARRFYSMFGLLGNFSLPLVGLVMWIFLSDTANYVSEDVKLMPVLITTLFSGLLVIFLYSWINRHVLTDPLLYDPTQIGSKKKKSKLSLGDSFKMIFTSKYLGLLVILVLSYGVSIILVEGVWKAQVRELYPSTNEYTKFMGVFQTYQGFAAILFMLVGSNILRRVSWKVAAIFTPIMIVITGAGFFAFIFFKNSFALHVAAFFGTGPLVMAVAFGMAQNVLSKATKYSLFDATKEMAYIPLDDEMKSKGKAAVDVIGGRFGKSGGGFIASTLFMLMPSYDFIDATPYFGAIFFAIVIIWIFAVQLLSKEYISALDESNDDAKKEVA